MQYVLAGVGVPHYALAGLGVPNHAVAGFAVPHNERTNGGMTSCDITCSQPHPSACKVIITRKQHLVTSGYGGHVRGKMRG